MVSRKLYLVSNFGLSGGAMEFQLEVPGSAPVSDSLESSSSDIGFQWRI